LFTVNQHPPSKFIHGAREDRLEALGVFAVAPAGLAAGVALEMVGAVLGDVGVVVPQVLLALMHSMAARFLSQTSVMSRKTSGFQPICSVWCGSNR
jgi:hypothetical protein